MGYPDSQAYSMWRGAPFLAAFPATITLAAPLITKAVVGSWASTHVQVQNASGGNGVDCQVNFYSDDVSALIVWGYDWQVPAGLQLDVLIPNMGDYMQVTVTAHTGTATPDVSITPSNLPVTAPRYTTPGNQVASTGLSIAAGVTDDFRLPFVADGQGFLHCLDRDHSGKVAWKVISLDATGAQIFRVVNLEQPTTNQEVLFQPGAQPVQLAVTNSDTIAHTVDFFMNVLT